MSHSLELNRLAIHYVDKLSEKPAYAPRELNIQALDSTITDFLLKRVSEVWDALDAGPNCSAHFDKQSGPLVAKRHVQTIIQGKGDFFGVSKELAQHLHQQLHVKASPGLLAVIRLVRPSDGKVFVALLKIRHKDEKIVKMLSEALTQLEVEHVKNMLLQDIQKGAIVPHPTRDSYDLKIVDKTGDGEPTQYFASFLGCRTKKSDEHQVKKLLPTLQEYAQVKNLRLSSEKLPLAIAALQKHANVTTKIIAKVVQENGVLDPDFQLGDLEKYINQQSALGPVDIPRERFVGSGKGGTPRKIIYKFKAPPLLRGVTISGSPEAFENIISVKGDTVTFRLETTRDSFDVFYD
jgi:hypothetical protein